ncbi:MAG: DUF1800 domain-containing protein [Luteimonas sp.]|nr:DUF1800 domain-containing protein [Luteimonas sp.]
MAAETDRADRATIQDVLTKRYGYDPAKASRAPVITPPTQTVPRRRDFPTPPTTTVTRNRELPAPSLMVRTFGQLTYGLTPTSAAEFAALGSTDVQRRNAFIEAQLAWESIDDSAVESRLTAAGYSTLGKTLPQLWTDHIAANPEYSIRMRPSWEAQRAALVRAVHSKRQLRELLATFWHDHFNVMVSEYDAGPLFVHYTRDVIRQHAFGNFRTMLEAVATSTSMLYFLDNRSNTRSGPNENFARELLELHTFGADNYLGFMNPSDVPPCPEDTTFPIGYTDIDVYETAAAFTGWSVKNGHWQFPAENDGTFVYRSLWHDSGPKFVLGRFIPPDQAAQKDGRDVLDRIVAHPRVAKFICKKLIRRFVSDAPSQALIDSAAAVFRQNSQNANQIRLVLRHILLSDEARNSWGDKMRRPFEAVAATMRALGTDWTLRVGDAKSDEFMWRHGFTGHNPYDWPAPNGYPDVATAWSGSNSFAMTWKVQNWLTETNIGGTGTPPRIALIVETTRSGVPAAQWTATRLVDFWCMRILGYLPVASRRQALIAFMAQNGDPGSYLITDNDAWSATDLKKHYNHQRLRSMVSLILMSPEFFSR